MQLNFIIDSFCDDDVDNLGP